MIVNILISAADVILSLVFTVLILRQYFQRKRVYQLVWGVALGLWTVGVAAEVAATVRGWGPLTYRGYYATGALLIPAWLGMGTLFLVMRRQWSNIILIGLIILSVIGIGLIAFWPIQSAQLHNTGGNSSP
jgi:hypothetical protein